ncbi:MAG: hypothetical protein U0790_25675 [Isosphaeraceae bacterium]
MSTGDQSPIRTTLERAVSQPSPDRQYHLIGRRRSAATLMILGLAGIVATSRNTRWTASALFSGRDPGVDSPYLNTRPEVRYLGDAVCARCHGEIASAFRDHPMGRSLSPVAAGDGPPIGTAAGLPFEFKGVSYDIDRRDGRTVHVAGRPGGTEAGSRGSGRGPLRAGSGRVGSPT